jgi:hypothetical protein
MKTLYIAGIILIAIILFYWSGGNLTTQERTFKEACETSGGTFIKCSGQANGFSGLIKGSCEPKGALECFCPPMNGLIERDGVCYVLKPGDI